MRGIVSPPLQQQQQQRRKLFLKVVVVTAAIVVQRSYGCDGTTTPVGSTNPTTTWRMLSVVGSHSDQTTPSTHNCTTNTTAIHMTTHRYHKNNNTTTHPTKYQPPYSHSQQQQPQPKQQQRTTWTKEAYPNPMIHPVQCRRTRTSSTTIQMCDPDGLVSSHDLPTLESKLRSFSQYFYYTTTPSNTQLQPPVQIQMYIAFVRKVCVI